MSRATTRQYTKEEIKTVLTKWNTTTVSELCEHLGLEKNQLNYIVAMLKRAGAKFTRKRGPELIVLYKEVVDDFLKANPEVAAEWAAEDKKAAKV